MGEYKQTLNLPSTKMPMKAGLSRLEPQILENFSKKDIYALSLKKNEGQKEFVLHDGPPYPNGNIHVGHALNKILKDIVVKYKTMRGYFCPFRPGWDCHGLPIETQLLKELNQKKESIPEEAEFREKCKEYSLKYVEVQKEQFKRLGIRADWQNPYLTLSQEYESKVYEVFDILNQKGFVYKGRKPIHWCCDCKTALAEAEIEHDEIKSPSIYIKFQVVQSNLEIENTSLIVWTTTPWTLPANTAVAVNPSLEYALAATEKGDFLLSLNLLDIVLPKIGIEQYKIKKTFLGSDLTETICKHPFFDRAAPVILGDFVTDTDGSGCVHIAPGHGQEDYLVGLEYNLPVIMPVDDKGILTEQAGEFSGLSINEANKAIVQKMQDIDVLLKLEFINHSYPHCWRCHSAVIFRATEQWFISMSHNNLQKKAIQAIKDVNWIPKWGINRIGGMLEKRPDWCISRQRLWGLKIPLQGVSDIMDVWLESGASFASVLGEKQADLYLEGSDQHRGWFQSSLLLSLAARDKAPYKSVLTHGFTVDEKGRKMSKSLGNVVDPLKVVEKYGADILRLWVSSTQFKDDMSISEGLLQQVSDSYSKIRNTFRFLISNLYDYDFTSKVELTEIDKWILTRLAKLNKSVIKAYEEYEYHRVYHAIHDFCVNDLSSFYLDIIKDRLYCDAKDSNTRLSSQKTIAIILETMLKMIAPILTFSSQEIWQYFKELKQDDSLSDFIELTDFPDLGDLYLDYELEQRWQKVFELRAKVYQKIEEARQSKVIASSLEAKALIILPEDLNISEQDLAMVLIVSQVSISKGDSLEIIIEHASGQKCDRCWRWLELDNGLCNRCKEVVSLTMKIKLDY